jgi:hypothetical protein
MIYGFHCNERSPEQQNHSSFQCGRNFDIQYIVWEALFHSQFYRTNNSPYPIKSYPVNLYIHTTDYFVKLRLS